MRFIKPFLIAGLLLWTGFLAGCDNQPPRMKNQPTNLNSGEPKINLPGHSKPFGAGQ
jgi:hypothetical protein